MKLSDAIANNTYTIASLDFENSNDAMHFSSLGFVPGAKIMLVQNSPYKICSVGNGRIAISDSIANMITILP